MRTGRPSSLKQRLRRGDPMDFSALLQGVSTLEEAESAAAGERASGLAAGGEPEAPAGESGAAAVPEPPRAPAGEPDQPAAQAPSPDAIADAPAAPPAALPAPAPSHPVRVDAAGPSPTAPLYTDAPTFAAPARHVAAPKQDERLRTALDGLGCQLTLEIGRMATALRSLDADEAGFRLSRVNQILDLLHSIDATGDVSRQLGLLHAPPPDRAWPAAAWTVVEFAESPFSGLLPDEADEPFVRELLYSAWGVGFDA